MADMEHTPLFVPFCDTVIRRYSSVRELPRHDVMDPKLLHGEIRLTLTAKTPLIVAGGKRVREGSANVACFAKYPDGRFRIPGSSLRGLIRQNMQILGLGLIRVGRNDDIAPDPVSGGRHPADGLPASYHIQEDQDVMDYPHSVMGFVGRAHQVPGRWKKVIDCYRTRVSVGDLDPVGTPIELRTVLLDQEAPAQDSPAFVTKTGSGFRLKGYRQYPLRPLAQAQSFDATQGFRPLAAGTKFTGSIRYRNLHEDELGLLLWCLRLEAGCLHTMGMAKSAGYGQVELTIDALVEHEPNRLYGSLTTGAVPRPDSARRIGDLIAAYQRKAAQLAGVASLPRMPHIQAFLAAKTPSSKPLPVQPAEPPKSAGPSQKELRRQAKKVSPQASQEDVSNWRAKLSDRFKSN